MDILHINSNYLHTSLHSEMLAELEKYDVNSDVIMPRKINDESNVEKHLKYNHANIIHSKFLKKSDRFFYFKKQKKIKNWIKKQRVEIEKYDVIHAHTLFTDGYQAFKANKPYVVTVRNTDVNFYFKYYKHLYNTGKKILKKADFIIFLSEAYKHKTIETLFKDSIEKAEIYGKSKTIPNGINNYWLDNSVTKKKKLTENVNILCVGRIMKNKNIDFLAKNLTSELFSKTINIYVVGKIIDVNYMEKLNKYANIHYLGEMSKENLRQIMEDMHMLALISFNETFGLVYLEAITQNLPVLYTKNEGFDKYFEDGVVGYPVSPFNGDELRLSLKEVIQNYNEFQNNIINIEKQSFGWNSKANEHHKIYKSIIKGY